MSSSPLKKLASLAAASAVCFTANALADTQLTPGTYFSVPRVELRLQNADRNCELTADAPDGKTRTFKTSLPWPCTFHRDPAGKVRTKQQQNFTYLLLESSTRVGPNECDTFVQAARISGKTVQLSKHRSRLASCPPFQWETPLFTESF